MPDPFKLLGVDPERAKQGAAYAGTQALDLLYSPLYMKALGDALSSFMGSTPQQPQQEAPTPEAAPYQALTGALMEPLRRLGEEQSGRVAELEALYPQFVQEALTGMRGLGEQYGEVNPELGPILAIMQLFHGSPHKFSKFRHADEVARTGQGANSFGHGIYLAENPAVANQYFKDLSRGVAGEISNAKNEIQRAQRENTKFADMLHGKLERPKNKAGNPVDDAWLKNQMADNDRYIEEANSWISKRQGRVYNVTGDFDPEDLLDWDSPLTKQPKRIQEQLAPLLDRVKQELAQKMNDNPDWAGMYEHDLNKINRGELRGREIYELLHEDQKVASQLLNEAGISGLRYLDQGSRAPHTIGAGKVLADQSTQVKRALGWDSDHPRSPIIEYLAQRGTSVPSNSYYQELRGKWRAANQKQRAEMLKGATVQDIMAHQYATNEPLVKEMERLGMRTRNVVWWGDPEKLQIKNPPE